MKVSSFHHFSRQTLVRAVVAIACVLPLQVLAQVVPEAPVLVSIDGVPVPAAPTTPTPPATGGTIPLSWNDPMFASVTNSGPLVLASGQSRSNLSIAEQSGQASIICNGSCNLDHIRISSREGPRCVSGNINISNMWIEAIGTGDDHADGLQCYGPGSTGAVTSKNVTFKAGGATNAAYFSADNWKGTHTFENVLFWGGNYGVFIPGDGGSTASFKNAYFVKDSFTYGATRLDETIDGHKLQNILWENVHWVTIVNGKMVIGAAIPKP